MLAPSKQVEGREARCGCGCWPTRSHTSGPFRGCKGNGIPSSPAGCSLTGLEVVVGRGEGGGGDVGGDTGGVREAEGEDTRASRDEEGVGVTVVAPDELEDLLALGEGAHEAEDREARLRAGRAEAHHLDAGHAVDDHLGELVLELAGGAEGRPLVDLGLEGVVHLVVGVPDDGRACVEGRPVVSRAGRGPDSEHTIPRNDKVASFLENARRASPQEPT